MPVAIDPGLPVRAIFLDAGGVQRQRMVLQPEAFFSCNRMLVVVRLMQQIEGKLTARSAEVPFEMTLCA